MTALDAMPTPDLAAIKQKQQATWSSGDYHMIGTQILLTSERLLEALDVHSTERVLDVATGSGNAALAAARRGCEVVGIDYVPALLDHARKRAEAEVLEATFMEGDAEALPFADGSFDVVTSVFGAMFAPDQERTASEIARVTRSGGRIGLVAHTPGGVHRPAVQDERAARAAGPRPQVARSCGAPRPACGSCSATRWPTSRSASATWCSATARPRRTSTTGATGTARRSRRSRLSAPTARMRCGTDLLDLIGRFNVAVDGSMVVPNEYLEAVITRR